MSEDRPENPYATPKTLNPGNSEFSYQGFQIRGKKLAVKDGAILPTRCIKTNEVIIPGENGRAKRLKISWVNPWWALLIFLPAGILILLLICLFNRNKATITVYLSRKAIRRKRLWLLSLVLIAIALPILFAAFPNPSETQFVIAFIGSIICLVIALFSSRYLAPTTYDGRFYLLKGAHRDFLNGLKSDSH